MDERVHEDTIAIHAITSWQEPTRTIETDQVGTCTIDGGATKGHESQTYRLHQSALCLEDPAKGAKARGGLLLVGKHLVEGTSTQPRSQQNWRITGHSAHKTYCRPASTLGSALGSSLGVSWDERSRGCEAQETCEWKATTANMPRHGHAIFARKSHK